MQFRTIDLERDRAVILKFRRSAFSIDFGSDENFSEEKYLGWLRENIISFPDGFVLVSIRDHLIGQLELTIHQEGPHRIGYVHLIYLIEEMRGFGLGELLHMYALDFFRSHGAQRYQLHLSATNERALAFYTKSGMKKLKFECGGKLIRMRGEIMAGTDEK